MSREESALKHSPLSRVIPPEIHDDTLYQLIEQLAASEPLANVLEIGSSAGGGSTEAFVKGLARNPGSPRLFCIEISKPRFAQLRDTYAPYSFVHCYNRSTVGVDEYPPPSKVSAFYEREESGLRRYPLSQVLDWLAKDIEYTGEAGVEAGAIESIKADHAIEIFDMVLIDGSEFTGEIEYEKVRGARIILLDDTNTFKCWAVRRELLNDPWYDVIADDQSLRNGYSAFRRRASPRRVGTVLPVHFFTIVLNGEPFIRYHEQMLRDLQVPWHWHVVEGVAELKHDTAWSVPAGGRISDELHDQGRSNDGTSGYLDELAARFPDNVTIYRKPVGQFWDGKREMVNAPLPNIGEECLLWQVDSDELWTADQIHAVHNQFILQPDRTAAWYWCWYYVGPDKVISTRYNYAQNPNQEWLRTWRYRPGATWAAHEPPRLVVSDSVGGPPVDLGRANPFTHDEMEACGAVFHHFAYATEAQLTFKEVYYGYKDARAGWHRLLEQRGSGKLADHFAWISDDTMFDDAAFYLVDPLAKLTDRTTSPPRWSFSGTGKVMHSPGGSTSKSRPRFALDGIFWQHLSSGIGRVWENILREWVKSGFAEQVIVLDRAGSAPRIAGIHYWSIAAQDYEHTGHDSLYLEEVCRNLNVDLFVSTYYSTPVSTPSLFSGYDMIPEVLATPMHEETWKEKHRAIRHASGHTMISKNSAHDLERFFKDIPPGSTHVVHLGVDPKFIRPSNEAIAVFRSARDLEGKDYLIIVGERIGYGDYKNAALAVRAIAGLARGLRPVLICVGGQPDIEPALRELGPDLDIRRLALGDVELAAAYAGALALLYPSKYEGFGLPPLEAMACGTPVIVCRNSSIPEVVGDAGIYVRDDDPSQMRDAITALRDPARRADLVERGKAQVAHFTFANAATSMAAALTATADRLASGKAAPPSPVWDELRKLQQDFQGAKVRGDTGATDSPSRTEGPAAGAAQAELELFRQQVSSMRKSPFWRAREVSVRALRRLGLRRRG